MNKIIQLTAGISLCLVVRSTQGIFYIFYIKPFIKKSENIIFLANELLLFCFYLGIIIPELSIIEINSEKLTIFEIRIVLTALWFNALVNILETLRGLCLKIKNRFFNNSLKISPLQTTSIEIKPYNKK